MDLTFRNGPFLSFIFFVRVIVVVVCGDDPTFYFRLTNFRQLEMECRDE